MNQPIVWVNGAPSSDALSLDRGLLFGDGVFETFARSNGHWVLESAHFDRLARGLRQLHISIDWSQLQTDWQRFQSDCGDNGVAKVIVTRGTATRGYAPASNGSSVVLLQWFEGLPTVPVSVALGVCEIRLAHQPALAGIKHLNRLEQVLASHEIMHHNWGDGLLLNHQGHVVETASKNLFFIKDDCLITPAITDCGVRGTLRDWLISHWASGELHSTMGLNCAEMERITLDDVMSADEMFVCNSVFGIVPVSCVGDKVFMECERSAQIRRWANDAVGLTTREV